jgi:hypothetical protein
LIAGNANAGIHHFDTLESSLVQATQAHAALTRVFDGVRDQVSQDLFDQRPVAVNAIGTGLYLQLQAFVGRYAGEFGAHFIEDAATVKSVGSGLMG